MDQATTAWFGVAIVALTLLLVLCCLICAVGVVYTRHRRDGKRAVWPDPESGAEPALGPGAACKKEKALNGSSRNAWAATGEPHRTPPTDLVETLRGLLKEEISKALQHEDISGRLERLERRDEASQSSVTDRLERLERSATQPQSPAYPPPSASPFQMPVPPPPSDDDLQAAALRAAASAAEDASRQCGEDPPAPGGAAAKRFGPTNRQLRLPDPPETSFDIDKESAAKTSLKTIRSQLSKRDRQTTELHRQLRQCQEALWEQTLEARSASKRLRDLLADPSKLGAEHAREVELLQSEVCAVSSKLADARAAEMRWSWIAKRQRAFFMQSEKMGQEGMDLVRRHPAGEVFVAPPPVCLEGDDEGCGSPPWDVGTSHINPYAIDSWPFEPNVLAQKASAEPNLNRLDEEEGSESGSPSGSEEGSPREEDPDSGEEEGPHFERDSDRAMHS